VRLLFDFRCSNGHTFERYVDASTKTIECTSEGCPDVAERIISPVRCKLDPLSGDFPGATIKWAEGRQKKIKEERKSDNHGDPDW
jgi:hypothetical protein